MSLPATTPTHLTVLFRDEMPTHCLCEPVTYRRVTIELTPMQRIKLMPRLVGKLRGNDEHEKISTTFLEVSP